MICGIFKGLMKTLRFIPRRERRHDLKEHIRDKKCGRNGPCYPEALSGVGHQPKKHWTMIGVQFQCTEPGRKLLNDCLSSMVVRHPTRIPKNFSSLFWVITHLQLIGFLQTPFDSQTQDEIIKIPPKIYQETPYIHKNLTSRTQNLHY